MSSSPAVELRSVSKVFKEEGQPDVTAVKDLALTIERGEIFCLVGPDGAGKTTTLRMMCGVLPPTSGEIEITGLSMKKDRQAIKNRIGYLSQRFSLYGDLTVDENIDFFAEIHKVQGHQERKKELLDFMRLGAFTDRLADRLSGGMKQKLALACTLIHRPEVIFLDEPTTGVDPVSRRDFWKILSSVLKSGISIIMATPYLDEAERSTRVALMNEGGLLGCDSPENVKASFAATVLEVTCEDPRAAMEAARQHHAQQSVQLFGDRLHVVLREGESGADEFLKDLQRQGIPVSSSRVIPPSLEDVFISRITS